MWRAAHPRLCQLVSGDVSASNCRRRGQHRQEQAKNDHPPKNRSDPHNQDQPPHVNSAIQLPKATQRLCAFGYGTFALCEWISLSAKPDSLSTCRRGSDTGFWRLVPLTLWRSPWRQWRRRWIPRSARRHSSNWRAAGKARPFRYATSLGLHQIAWCCRRYWKGSKRRESRAGTSRS